MPSRLSDPLYRRLRRTFPPDRAYARADWDDGPMPEPVLHFLEHTLRHHGRREARRLHQARTDWVDYDHPEMEEAARTFFEAMATHAQVPADEWDDTLRRAADRTTAYLVRPVPELVDFVFGRREEPLPLDRIQRRMQFLGPYAYLRKAVRAMAEKQDRAVLGPDTVESVLARVDQRIPSDFDADRWCRLLEPLFEVGRFALGHDRLPVALLQTFFEEKDRVEIVRRLTAYTQEGHDEVGPESLARLIEEGTVSSPDDARETSPASDSLFAPSSASPTTEASSESESMSDVDEALDDEVWGVSEATPFEKAEAPASGEEQGPPLWKQFQQGRSSTVKTESGEQSEGDGEPRWAQFRHGRSTRASQITEASAQNRKSSASSGTSSTEHSHSRAASPSRDASSGEGEDLAALEREVLGQGGPTHRSVYVQQLFGGDPSAYRQVLGRLRTVKSWSEASQIIASDIFRKHKVNIYSDAAVHFTNAVESRFRRSA